MIKKTIVDLSNEGLWNIEFVSGKKRYKVKYDKEKDEVFEYKEEKARKKAAKEAKKTEKKEEKAEKKPRKKVEKKAPRNVVEKYERNVNRMDVSNKDRMHYQDITALQNECVQSVKDANLTKYVKAQIENILSDADVLFRIDRQIFFQGNFFVWNVI